MTFYEIRWPKRTWKSSRFLLVPASLFAAFLLVAYPASKVLHDAAEWMSTLFGGACGVLVLMGVITVYVVRWQPGPGIPAPVPLMADPEIPVREDVAA